MRERQAVTEGQLREWIVSRVRRDSGDHTFAEPFGIVRRPSEPHEPSWTIGELTIEDWSPDSFVAFERATDEAQQRFDLR